jgi:molybdopterin-biosynthesis enzyme MoeA-like protein
MNHPAFGLIVIGDEILVGQREDRHFAHFKDRLSARGLTLSHCWLLPDVVESLTRHLQFSFSLSLPVFVCGGIGATPDDLTRECAAAALGVSLARHPGAAALIEARFGADAYPQRIRMADLPLGARLIPNPYNGMPGFSLRNHYFLPGFPQMAWPMAEWVLDEHFPSDHPLLQEAYVRVLRTPESDLIEIMRTLTRRYPELKVYSLPRIGAEPQVELGIRGYANLAEALELMSELLLQQRIPFEPYDHESV